MVLTIDVLSASFLVRLCGGVEALMHGRWWSDRPSVKRLGDDVLVSGGSRTLRQRAGDAILAGGDLSFSGATGGDYLGAGGQQAITGRIHGSLRAAGGEIHLAAAVDRNATIAGGDIVLDSAAVIARNAYLFGGKIEINGTVREGILAAGGSIVLNGVVGRDVESAVESLRVGRAPRSPETSAIACPPTRCTSTRLRASWERLRHSQPAAGGDFGVCSGYSAYSWPGQS